MKRIPVEAIRTAITDLTFVEGYCIKGEGQHISYRRSPFIHYSTLEMSFILFENVCLLYSWGQIGLRL